MLYVGTKYGMWSEGQFDLVVDGNVAFSGTVPHLLDGGALIDVGNVIDTLPKSGKSTYLTNIKGWVK